MNHRRGGRAGRCALGTAYGSVHELAHLVAAEYLAGPYRAVTGDGVRECLSLYHRHW